MLSTTPLANCKTGEDRGMVALVEIHSVRMLNGEEELVAK